MERNAQMAELVDAQVSGICAARRGGSSPLLGTNPLKHNSLFPNGFITCFCSSIRKSAGI